MKKTYLIILSSFFSIYVIAQTTYPSGVTGCIARWTFDAAEDQSYLVSLPDMSGNSNNGAPHIISSAPGFRNKPLKAGAFDGSTSWAEVADKVTLNPTNISIVSLIKFKNFYTGTCQGNNIIYKGFDYFNDVSWSMSVGEVDANCSAIDPSTEKLYFTGTGTTPYTPPLSNFIDSSKWYFLATTFDGATINFYQLEMDTNFKASNITPLYSIANPHILGVTMHNVFLGVTQNPPFKYWFNGSMDEVVLFNKALSNTEIQSVYDYLWGWSTNLDETSKSETEISLSCNGKLLCINSTSQKFKRVDVYDLSGRKVFECINQFDKINLGNINSQMLVAKITLGNNQVVSKKFLNH